MNRKTSKRALGLSFVSLLLCFTMLMGTTFAWFTDNASVSVNTIQSGDLKVGLKMLVGEDWVDAEGKTLDFKKASDAPENEKILWEPGCTYELPKLRIVNEGNLWLKYQVVITGIKGDAKLNKAIEWTYDGVEDGSLEPKESKDFTISGHMREDAGNEYKNLTIEGIAITVLATQKDAEFDSFDNTYDKNADFDLEGDLGDYVEFRPENPEDPENSKMTTVVIKDAAGLAKFAQVFGTDVTKDITTVEIAADISLKGYNWQPINAWAPENSQLLTINGKGHTISDMTVNGGSKTGFIGENARDITINDLAFDKANVTTSGSMAGVVIGYQYGNVVLNNVDVKNSTVKTTAEKGIRLGGLVGFSALNDGATLTVTNCDIDDLEVSGYHNVAGLVGTLYNYDELTDKWNMSGNTVKNSVFTITSGNEKYGAAFAVEGANYPHNYTQSNEYFTNNTGNTESDNEYVFPYYIKTVEDLKAVKADALCYLANDIDLAGVEWTAINNFAGTFDGQGHTISNLKDASLFDTVTETGVVKNVILKDASITNIDFTACLVKILAGTLDSCTVKDAVYTSNNKAGAAMVRRADASAKINNCHVDGFTMTVTSNDNGDQGGVLVASLYGEVTNSSVSNVTINASRKTKNWGGFVGLVSGGKVENCSAENVSITVAEYYQFVGGFVGMVNSTSTIKDCDAKDVTINVTSNGNYECNAGGFCGANSIGNGGLHTLDNCDVTGLKIIVNDVSNDGGVGAFTGRVSKDTAIKNCDVSGTINATQAAIDTGRVTNSYVVPSSTDMSTVTIENNNFSATVNTIG